MCCVVFFLRIYLFIFNLIICVGIFCLLVFVCSVCMQCPRELEEGVRSLGSGVTDVVGPCSVENLRSVFSVLGLCWGLQIIPFRLQVLTFFTWSFPKKEAVIFLRSGLSCYPVCHAFAVSSENLLGHEDFLLCPLRVALLI